jgi:hypothetical protein
MIARAILVMFAACSANEGAARIENRPPRDATVSKQQVGDPLPIAKGATWTYDVAIRTESGTQKLRWTTEVVDAYEGDGVRAYRVKGWPDDLASFDPPAAKLTTLVRSFDNYLWSTKTVATLDGAKPWFTWPLIDGQRICSDPGSRYCWQVSVEKGRYNLLLRTNPDDSTYELTPGIGLTRYIYHHHGSRLDIDAKLVERTPPR